MTDIPAVLAAIRPGSEWSLDGNDYAGLTWLSGDPKPSQKTIDDAWPQVKYDRDYKQVEEARRQRYMSETDGMFFAAQRQGGDLTEWTKAVALVKADLPYPEPSADVRA